MKQRVNVGSIKNFMKYIIALLIAFFLISAANATDPLTINNSFLGVPVHAWAHFYMGSTFVAARDHMGVNKEQAIMELILVAVVKEVIVDTWISGYKPNVIEFLSTIGGGIVYQLTVLR